MRYFYLVILILFSFNSYSQYYTQHYIAPAPWQYWSAANEIVIGTTETTAPVSVDLRKSDGPL